MVRSLRAMRIERRAHFGFDFHAHPGIVDAKRDALDKPSRRQHEQRAHDSTDCDAEQPTPEHAQHCRFRDW